MYEQAIPFIWGAALAWATWYPARRLSAVTQRWFFTFIITLVSFSFVGLPLEDGNWEGAVYELAALTVFVVLILVSWKRVEVLPVVWFLHGAWDLASLLGLVPVDKPLWMVQFCVPYDWLLAAYLITQVSSWNDLSQDQPADT